MKINLDRMLKLPYVGFLAFTAASTALALLPGPVGRWLVAETDRLATQLVTRVVAALDDAMDVESV